MSNNIFAFGGMGQPDGGLRSDPDPGQANSLGFQTNIVYLTNGTLFYGNWDPSSNPDRRYYFDTNVYWHDPAVPLTFPDGQTFQQWQTISKQDLNSLIVDPQFVDAKNFNFQLKPTSPALKLGFQNIDLSNVGPNWKPSL